MKRMKAILTANIKERQQRRQKFRELRRNNIWDDYIVKARAVDGNFMRRYKMTEASFNKLVGILDLPVNEIKSKNSTVGIDMISTNIIVASGLRWLGGEDFKSIEDTFHISMSSVQRVVNRFLDAVIECDHKDLAIELPKDDELEQIAEGWNSLLTAGGAMNGCVLAIDGFLSPRTCPNIENSRDFYTDRKSFHCLMVIAAIDYLGRFRYHSVSAPGGMNDSRGYHRCKKLRDWIKRLRDIRLGRYFGTADNAFPLSNHLLIPFRRSQLNGDRYKDSYNYYLSQLRIQIEMAFGRMTTKFGLLRNKMRCSLETQSKALHAVAKLHNFIINNDGVPTGQPLELNANNQLDAAQLAANDIEPLPNGMGPNGFVTVDYEEEEEEIEDQSTNRRDAIVAELTFNEILRPDAARA